MQKGYDGYGSLFNKQKNEKLLNSNKTKAVQSDIYYKFCVLDMLIDAKLSFTVSG